MKTRVVCSIKRNAIAVVEDDVYIAQVVDDWDLEKVRRLIDAPGPRLRVERDQLQVDLFSEEADRYQVHPKWWGYLPAWCRRCGAMHLVRVDDLRTAVRARQREVLAEAQAVH